MSKMAELAMYVPKIEKMLDTTHLLCDDIAIALDIPVEYVHYVVESRWARILYKSTNRENMSPYATMNS